MQYSPVSDEAQKAEQHNQLSLHIRIPLVSETGIELVRGSHKRWDTERERQVRFELDGFKNSDELEGGQAISLTAGNILLFNAQMLHRGNYALNKQRMALDLCVGSRHEFTESFLDASVLPTEEEMVEIGNNDWYGRARDIVNGRRRSQA